MGFWIFMFICVLLIPLTTVGLGKLFIKNPPKEINKVFGYRTSMSMKNKYTWEFAHKYCGELWVKLGLIMIVPTVIVMLFLLGKDADVVGMYGGILCIIQAVFLLFSIFPTEKALRKNFDVFGNRKR
ncbi:membrane protein [Fervidicella metallireducens AeB]|uniref:Membrane protein n=1 Tax=Fervidicella metallireducens AeB TaxID=1403537 RepID=A0A017RR51_9CLOT|nr:SdpI family protein [Fervidicella metallireducens]EYE87243.1 membrane protein [Fervidicella metallireducens AeB]